MRRLGIAAALLFGWALAGPAVAQQGARQGAQPAAAQPVAAANQPAPPPDDGVHLGVASCAGGNCHGADERLPGARVAQNEYKIWSQRDKHRLAYAALTGERGQLIARNLGLVNGEGKPDAAHAQICLDCHADNVPAARRGRQFRIEDGVGCEACHGGAVGWLGIHISGSDHRANIAAGMYPTDQPLARAERCEACHVVNSRRPITHEIMGAGHPPLPFELDRYTFKQPAHFTVDASYIERKGRPDDVQIWAVGQAYDLRERMDAILDPKNAPKGVNPELVLFDCQSCHHSMSQLQWRPRAATGLGPGKLRLQDASIVMLRTIASRVAPDTAKALAAHLQALHRATTENWDAVKREAGAVKQAAESLMPDLTQRRFERADIRAMADAVIAIGLDGEDLDYSGAQQQAMALGALTAAFKAQGGDAAQFKPLDESVSALDAAVADDQKYRPDEFVQALRQFQQKLPQ